jgi:nucleoside 2-deoxyribosyltransferase
VKTVYLCGGINGLSDAECKGWRDEATRALIPAGFFVLDPMTRDYRGTEADNARTIVHGDLFDIMRSDVLLVNAVRPSWGTAMEVGFAFRPNGMHRKTVIAFNVPAKPSPWLVYHCDRLFPTLAEALEYVKGLA